MRGNSKCKKVIVDSTRPVRQSKRKCAVPKYFAIFDDDLITPNSKPEKSKNKPNQHRNSQKRKEKSRDAARSRRGKESQIFCELDSALPLPTGTVSNLDKASIMRLCIAYLKTRDLINRGLPMLNESCNKDNTLVVLEDESLLLRALDGFVLVMSSSGDVVYASKNISTFLGLSQIDTMGQSIMEFAHPCDHEDISHFLSQKRDGFRNAFIRLKCTITPKGRSVNLKSASYKVVHMCGRVMCPILCKETCQEALSKEEQSDSWVVALAVPVPHPSNIEIPLDKQIFISRHNLDMKFTYVDESINSFCGYDSSQLMGRSMYEMNHALDADQLRNCFKILFAKGQVETSCYRFLALGGGFIWVVTQATLISSSKDTKPQCVVCLNYVVSDVIEAGSIISEVQILPELSSTKVSSPSYKDEAICKEEREDIACSSPKSDISAEVAAPACYPMPVAATSSLLMERTEDMEEGFLTFSSDPYSAVFKEEPEDLTHLAPSVGDDFLPLDIPLLYPSDIEDFLKGEPLHLSQGLVTGSSDIIYPFVTDGQSSGTDSAPTSLTNAALSRIKYKLEEQSNLVPDLVRSPYRGSSESPITRRDTPDPPSLRMPLLSQTSISLTSSRKLQQLTTSHRPSSITAQSTIEDFPSSSSTMDLFSSMDLKLEDEGSFDEEDYDLRAPYIPPMDDMLCSTQEALMRSQDLLPTFDLLPMLDKQDDVIGDKYEEPNYNLLLRSHSPLQHSKGCVDPNKVLPGHFRVKEKESEKDYEELRHLLQKATNRENTFRAKRSYSPVHRNSKKVRALSPQPVFAPTMQQLLVSKEPAAKCRFVGSMEERGHEEQNDSHSVLRNLLVSGYDERAGYTVVVAGLANHKSSLKNDRQLPASLQNLATLPVNSEGKVELTKQQLSTLLGSAGLRYVSLGKETVSQSQKKCEYLVINSSAPKLRNLSQIDCEVNAPAPTPALLQGSELLNALDQTI